MTAVFDLPYLQMIARFGERINHPDSVYYWAWKNNIPVFCPAITDGSIGDMLFFHSYKNPGLVVDVVGDIRAINDSAMRAAPRRTGMIILGGGEYELNPCEGVGLMDRQIGLINSCTDAVVVPYGLFTQQPTAGLPGGLAIALEVSP